MEWFNYNGKLYKASTPVIGADSRALRFGDGIFETIKLKQGKLMLANEHFARLWKGMEVLQLAVPRHFEPEKLQDEIFTLAKKNLHDIAARVRITVFRGDGGLYDAADHKPNYIIQTWALPEGNGEWNSNGLVLGIYSKAKKNCDILSNIKHNNYLPYVLAALEAKKEKWNDAVVLNAVDRICDTTIANIFYIKNEVIFTPALSEGCVAGTTRKFLIDAVRAGGYECIEKAISTEELLQADEVFLTNSIYNIRWVHSINDATFGNAITQKIYTSFVPTIW
jgi:branched-chain amino acid aminotransferase